MPPSAIEAVEALLSRLLSGKHRRALPRDVLLLKEKLDGERNAMKALVEDARDLNGRYGA